MNEKRLLFWLTDIDDGYVLEAVERFSAMQRRPRRRLTRLLVLAAAVAAMLAVAAVGYGVSQSMYAKKQEQLRLEYLPQGQNVPSYVEFVPTEEIPTGTYIELLSTVRSHETMQEGRYAITTDDPVLIDALYGGAPELRCDNLFVIGGLDGKDEENNTAYYTIQMVLPEDAEPGTTYSVEVWVRHPKLWVPEDNQTAEPVEEPPSNGNWVQWPVCLGTLEMIVTDFSSALVEFGDSLAVPLESGVAYICFAEIRPQGVSWIVSLPEAIPQDSFIASPIAPVYMEMVDTLANALLKKLNTIGRTATTLRKRAPIRVILEIMPCKKSDVGCPGRMPGMAPLFFLKLLAISVGLYWMVT